MPQTRSRRDLFRYAAAGMASIHLPAALSQTGSDASTPDSPEAAFKMLTEGNARYLKDNLRSLNENLEILRKDTMEKQEPFAAVLSCADSRVPPELIFDQSIGHIFVVRIAGNIATSDAIASLEYAVAVLHTKAILVLGHTNCGAVKATVAGKAVPGQISTLFPYIHPAVVGVNGDVEMATRRNASLQLSVLSQASPLLAEEIAQHKLLIRAAVYDVHTGAVSLLPA